jgi:alkyl hydroperoxide reductase subunit AhpF
VLAELAEKISLSINNIEEYPKLVQQYNVQNTPMLVICGRDQDKTIDYGIRFLGIPSGYEFSSLIQAISLVSKRASCLIPETRKEIKTLQIPLQLKVFVTPT